MATDVQVNIRPRTTGEVLDDAIRLSLADAPPLLALSGLFLVPASIALLLLLALPASAESWRMLVFPGAAALLLPLTGLGSGACQELFRRRADDSRVSLVGCLRAVLRRGLDHIGVTAILGIASIPGIFCLVFLLASMSSGGGAFVQLCLFTIGFIWNAAILTVSGPTHALLAAGNIRCLRALQGSLRESQRQPAKSGVCAVTYQALFAFAVLNLHVLISVGLWIAGNLAGFDIALLDVVLVRTNPAYSLALILLAGWLLAPFAEACNYLLHVDSRVRYEGLDLWYRVQRLFPAVERSRASVIFLTFLTFLACASPSVADDRRVEAIQTARQEVRSISNEANAAEPYPSSAHWTPRLRTALDAVKRAGEGDPKRHAWIDKAVEQFSRQQRKAALQTLAEIDEKLALIEESLSAETSGTESENARRLLGPDEARKLLPDKPTTPKDDKAKKEPPPRKQADDIEIETKGRRGSGIMVPAAGGGFSIFGWLLLAGLFVACVVVATVLFVQQRRTLPKIEKPKQVGETAPSLESVLAEPDQHTIAALWQQADELALQGQFLEAVRRLYLAVLALLHRSQLIRYEKTRTNGEYMRQVRLAPEAPAELHASFGRLTRLFDQKWYGDRACDVREYGDCRTLAEEVRAEVKG